MPRQFLALSVWLCLTICIVASSATADELSANILPGLARPANTLIVYSPTNAVIGSIPVVEGESVTLGQTLVQLDERQATVKVAILEAQAGQKGPIAQAEAELERARKTLLRLLNVQKNHELPHNEVEMAESNVRKAEAALQIALEDREQVKLQLELEQLRLAEHCIKAPYAGKISRITATVGELVPQEKQLLTLVDLSSLVVDLQIPVEFMSRLTVGETYQLRALAPINHVIPGCLESIDPVLEPGTLTLRCLFRIKNEQLEYPAGFLVLPPTKLAAPTTAASSLTLTPP